MEDKTRVDVFLGGKKIVSGILVDITNAGFSFAGFSFFNEVPQIAITLIPCPETLSAAAKSISQITYTTNVKGEENEHSDF